MNKVILTGRTTKDIELKVTPSGNKVTQFTLAVDKRVNGEQQTDFVNCVAWNKVAELLQSYVYKGYKIGVIGRLSTRNYKDQNNKTIYVTEVVVDELEFLESKKEQTYTQPKEEVSNDDDYNYTTALRIDRDDLPF